MLFVRIAQILKILYNLKVTWNYQWLCLLWYNLHDRLGMKPEKYFIPNFLAKIIYLVHELLLLTLDASGTPCYSFIYKLHTLFLSYGFCIHFTNVLQFVCECIMYHVECIQDLYANYSRCMFLYYIWYIQLMLVYIINNK